MTRTDFGNFPDPAAKAFAALPPSAIAPNPQRNLLREQDPHGDKSVTEKHLAQQKLVFQPNFAEIFNFPNQ